MVIVEDLSPYLSKDFIDRKVFLKETISRNQDLDDLINLLLALKDVPFDQEYLTSDHAYNKFVATLEKYQYEQLDDIISQILFDMRTCE